VDLVLLDEPTNHLDLETIDWLKRYLGEFGETLIVISHDRAFLDDAVDHVLHVAGRTTTAYRGGYTAFVTQRAERQLALERQVAQQRKLIAKEEDYIRRNIAGQNSAQAKGRRARLARLPHGRSHPGARLLGRCAARRRDRAGGSERGREVHPARDPARRTRPCGGGSATRRRGRGGVVPARITSVPSASPATRCGAERR
jgi:ATPase subunit of ABC transporter with duplicated ATPase domains